MFEEKNMGMKSVSPPVYEIIPQKIFDLSDDGYPWGGRDLNSDSS